MNKQPMRLRRWLFGVVPLVALLATGCSPVADPGGPTARTPAEPPKTATAMVCETEVEDEIAAVLGLPTSQPPNSTWSDKLLTCTYRYGDAVMVVSVKELADAAAAESYYSQQLAAVSSPVPFPDLGDAAFATNNGSTYVRKDEFVLRVDVSGLPDTLGPKNVPRNRVGIAVASEILGCWDGG